MSYGATLLKKTGLYEPARASWLRLRQPQWWRRKRDQWRFYAGLFPRGSLCFDVGANNGEYTADLLEVGARVVAVEPQAGCLKTLRRRFGTDPRVAIVPAAVGPQEGTIAMHVSDASEIASCSTEWMDAVKTSGRFAGHDWTARVEVPMTTLDRLIAGHGWPAFCKIDVEGFELDVLRGLRTPIPVMSFEFSPETLDRTCACVEHLARLDPDYRFNLCAHGHYAFALPDPLPADAFGPALRTLSPQAMKWGGDVYAWSSA